MGSEFFNVVQYGKENPAARGTPVACTQMWIGQMQPIRTDRKPTYPKEHFGVRSDALRSVIHQRLYTNTLSTEHGAFQHLPFMGGIGLKGAVSAAEQTTGQHDYLWAQTPSLTAANNPDSGTLRFGDDVQAYISEYVMAERIRISGQVAQGMDASPVRLEMDVFGRQIAESTFTAALTPRTLEPMNAKFARLYLDSAWASVGSTEAADLLRTFDIEILTGVHPKFAGSTAQTFNRHAEGVIAVTGTFGIEGGSTAADLFADQQNNVFTVARLEIAGSQIGTGDTHLFQLDFGGTFEDASPINSEDRGDNLAQFVLRDYYDTTSGLKLQWNVTTDINAY